MDTWNDMTTDEEYRERAQDEADEAAYLAAEIEADEEIAALAFEAA